MIKKFQDYFPEEDEVKPPCWITGRKVDSTLFFKHIHKYIPAKFFKQRRY